MTGRKRSRPAIQVQGKALKYQDGGVTGKFPPANEEQKAGKDWQIKSGWEGQAEPASGAISVMKGSSFVRERKKNRGTEAKAKRRKNFSLAVNNGGGECPTIRGWPLSINPGV